MDIFRAVRYFILKKNISNNVDSEAVTDYFESTGDRRAQFK